MLYFDDIEVGYQSEVGTYTLTEAEVIEFASTWDPQPFHIDKEAASASIFGGLTASSLHLFAICTRLFFDHEDRIQILAMLGKEAIRIPNPARPGDVLTYSTECIQKKPSSSRPDRGVITLKDTLANQDGEPVLTQEVALLVARQNNLSD
ncbi:MAG: MaoC/PaaZ C-terminal domain-containing protein [Gammaproteobacteria bacterium]|nr:MaoC/PaaZ C-terminal domain-containing protein [Gammaproteobacteria bacterium]